LDEIRNHRTAESGHSELTDSVGELGTVTKRLRLEGAGDLGEIKQKEFSGETMTAPAVKDVARPTEHIFQSVSRCLRRYYSLRYGNE